MSTKQAIRYYRALGLGDDLVDIETLIGLLLNP